jgi:hypothetical protein
MNLVCGGASVAGRTGCIGRKAEELASHPLGVSA